MKRLPELEMIYILDALGESEKILNRRQFEYGAFPIKMTAVKNLLNFI